MKQTVIHDFPPIYHQLEAAFDLQGRTDVVFAFGEILYNPHRVYIPPEILVHEAIHGQRQVEGPGVYEWWKRYIGSAEFRLIEEAEAHRAEYRHLLENGNRKQRRHALAHVANKFASPLYGKMVTPARARRILGRTD